MEGRTLGQKALVLRQSTAPKSLGFLFESIDGVSYTELALRRNNADHATVALRQRAPCDGLTRLTLSKAECRLVRIIVRYGR
jgi:hypothetical protein